MRRNTRRRVGVRLFACLVISSGLPAMASALPLISEVLYDASSSSSDDGRVFVEIAGLPGTSLDGFTLEGANGCNGTVGPVLVLSGVVGARGLFVFADMTSAGTSSAVDADLLLDFDFQDGRTMRSDPTDRSWIRGTQACCVGTQASCVSSCATRATTRSATCNSLSTG